jgi:hypothetical protein
MKNLAYSTNVLIVPNLVNAIWVVTRNASGCVYMDLVSGQIIGGAPIFRKWYGLRFDGLVKDKTVLQHAFLDTVITSPDIVGGGL